MAFQLCHSPPTFFTYHHSLSNSLTPQRKTTLSNSSPLFKLNPIPRHSTPFLQITNISLQEHSPQETHNTIPSDDEISKYSDAKSGSSSKSSVWVNPRSPRASKLRKQSYEASWTFSSMITIYSCSGKVSEAEEMLNDMVEAGFDPNIFVLTSLIQCYGKAKRVDDVVRTFNQLIELGLTPDDRFCGCLLNVITQTPKEEISKLIDCVVRANPKLGFVVELLLGEQDKEGNFRTEASELFSVVSADVRKAYCNCLIDLCVNLDLLDKACELLNLGLTLQIYKDLQSRSPTQWSLYLKGLSLGAALTALHVWINDLTKVLESGEELPPLLGINTGHGKHKYSDKGLASVFESHLKELNAPFHEAPEKVGWFLTTKVAAKSWLESRSSPELVAA
uniref:Smr domain-containing protein n=1 Tax=Cucumis melo TaxID=3656 RepID=A0A9I9E0F7_CUCME